MANIRWADAIFHRFDGSVSCKAVALFSHDAANGLDIHDLFLFYHHFEDFQSQFFFLDITVNVNETNHTLFSTGTKNVL